MTAPALRYRLRPDGPWQAVLPGVYRERRGALSDQQRAVAAFLYAGRAIAITGTAAIAWHGAPVKHSDFVDVLVPLHQNAATLGSLDCTAPAWSRARLYDDGALSMRRWTGRSSMRLGS